MKALKEKRIGLRSLWRRGLVILSLFALVFASCNDSDGSASSASSGGPRVVSFSVKKGPTEPQYMGQPVDFTGMVLNVKYSDGNWADVKYEDAKSQITTNPRLVTGWYFDKYYLYDETFLYDLIFDGVHADAGLHFGAGQVNPLITDFILQQLFGWEWDKMAIEGLKDLGLHLTGVDNMPERVIYTDDDMFDFTGLTLEADYIIYYDDWIKNGIIWRNKIPYQYADAIVQLPKIERKPVQFSDVTWEIRPRYEEGKDVYQPDGLPQQYDGYVFVTVGQDFIYNRVSSVLTDRDWWDYTTLGLTTLVPLPHVYTVKNKDAIKLVGVPDDKLEALKTFFFWESNTKEDWIRKLGDDAALEVTYTNDVTQTKYIRDLKVKNDIYLNANPQGGASVEWTEEGVYLGPKDFDIMVLKYPFNKKNTDLGIRLYYRGALYKIDVDVYTTLLRVEATPNPVDHWHDPTWDNDVDNGPGGPAALASKLEVKGFYQAINDPSKTTDHILTYLWSSGSPPYYRTGPYYIFGSDETIDDEDETDGMEAPDQYGGTSTYAKGVQKYLNNKAKGKDTTTNVVIRHSLGVEEIVGYWTANYWAYYWSLGWRLFDWNRYMIGTIFPEMIGPWTITDILSSNANNAAQYPGLVAMGVKGGMLPDGFSIYEATATKAPFKKGDPRRAFGPKINQTKKTKIQVHWVDHY